jgi:outer membrane protein TolC
MTMDGNVRSRWMLGLAGLILLAGCIEPGDVDPTVLYRYQRELASRDGDDRLSADDLGLYQPAGNGIPRLMVRTVTKRFVKHDAVARLAENDEAFDPNDLYEARQVKQIPLTLEQAIVRALANNLEVQISGYDPAISRQDMVQAAAEFDPVVFGEWSYEKRDRQGSTLGQTKNRGIQGGIRQKLITGGTWSASFVQARNFDDVNGSRWEPEARFEFTQPLLRNAWPSFNLARLRIARVSHKAEIEGFRATVEDVVGRVIQAYWTLQQAQIEMEIVEGLLEETIATHKKASMRPEARENVEQKQTNSAVVSRQLELLRAEKAVGDAREALEKLLADPQVNLRSDAYITPVTLPDPTPVNIDVGDQLLTALRHNPVLQQARYAISVAAINVEVARNQTLPRLDLTLSGGLHGRDRARGQANDYLYAGDYASYSMAIAAEYPIGNRERLAELYARRLERAQSITRMQETADQIAQLIQERIREIGTTHQEWQQRNREVAMLRKLVVGFETLVQEKAMTPNNLQLLLDAQARLATALRAQARALVGYQNAQTDLARVTGTILQAGNVKIALPAAVGEAPWPKGLFVEPDRPEVVEDSQEMEG